MSDNDFYWTERAQLAWRNAEPVPKHCPPPYFIIGPTDKITRDALDKIGWLRSAAYAPHVAHDGNAVLMAFAAVIEEHEIKCRSKVGWKPPYGTVFIVQCESFHKTQTALITKLMKNPQWEIADLPRRASSPPQ